MMDLPNDLDWNHLRAFLETARTGTLSAAARKLGQTQPTLSRQVAALEDSLSLMLFERIGRRLELTEAGRDLLAQVEPMGQAADRVALTASGRRSDIGGRVRITASDMMSAYLMPDVIARLRQIAPQIFVEVIATNDIQDLMRREADIAIRHMRPEQPDLVARLIQEAEGHFYGSKSYLDRVGRPTSLAQTAAYDWVSFGEIRPMQAYMETLNMHAPDEVFRAGSENGLVVWEMAKAGLGLCPMDAKIAARSPEMEPVFKGLVEITYPVWLVTHREIHTSPRIRLVFDLLADMLAER